MSSTASASGARVSMFGAKSGFVIPKNKLSGSLVPVYQSGKNLGGGNTGNEQNTKQGQRKTKWGPDLTQDAAVKKGRALAYQKRVDQITQKLESGTLEAESNQDLALASRNVVEKSSDSQTNSERVELLELERREAIGEIIKLNPRYKAPPDFKPLMKEARLPIPVKKYPDFNFLSLIFGSRGDAQKQLEKETGAKIQVFGTKAGAGEKVEIPPPDGNEIQAAYEELYVKISADTYDKVDAAVAVIELLITSVSGFIRPDYISGYTLPFLQGNFGASSASASGPGDTSSFPSNSKGTAVDLGAEQPTGSFTQSPESQFQCHGLWFPLASNQTPVGPSFNSSASSVANPIPALQLQVNSLNPPSLFGHQPSPVLQNASLLPSSQSPMRGTYAQESLSIGLSGPPRTFSVPGPRTSLVQPAFSAPLPFSGSQVEPIGPRPLMRLSAALTLQPVSSVPFRPRLSPDIGLSNTGLVAQPLVPNLRPQPVGHQSGLEQPSISFPPSIRVNHPAAYSSGGSLRPIPASVTAPAPIAGRPSGSLPVNIPSFRSINPPATAPPRPLHGDFTFQPRQPNIIHTPEISPRPNIQSAPPLGGTFPQPTLQPPVVNLASRPVMQAFPGPQHFGRQIDQSQTQLPSLFPANLRSPAFENFGPPVSQMRPRNFPPPPQFPNLSATLPPRPVFRHNNPAPAGRPQNHQQFYGGGQQVYDPFSPTDV